MRALWALALLVIGMGVARAAESPPVHSARVTATLVSETDSVAPGKSFRVALRLAMAPGWHTYWHNPGDAGVAPELTFTLPAGATAGATQWPVPAVEHEGPLTTYGYSGELLLPVTISGATGATPVQLHAEWLVCAKICVPEAGDFRLDLPAGTGAPSPQAGLFAAADQLLPRPSPWPARIAADGTLFVPGLTAAKQAWFAADTPDWIAASGAQRATITPEGLLLALTPGPAFKPGAPLAGVLVVRDDGGMQSVLQLTAAPGEVPAAATELWRLLGFALLGGLVLNLMPCVFPVLVVKAVGLAGLAGARRREAALHAASYAGGVLLAFAGLGGALLAARAAGGSAGWGFQFQSPGFVAAIAWLLFAVGLNLSGVFAVGGGLSGAGHALAARGGHAGSFFTGLLAVLVATPCTAPFMGAAVAGALAAPPAAALSVFLAMGVGLAAPYVALALVPGVARALPRPGRWMDVVKQALAFPMYAAAAWLVWVLAQEAGPDGVLAALGGIVLLGLAGWALGLAQMARGRFRQVGAVTAAAATLGALALLTAVGGAAAPATVARADDGTEKFSAARLAALQAEGRPVFVDMTAAWCVTCLVNEHVALAPAAVRRAFAEGRVAYLKGDWTRQDPEITEFLRRHGRDGVPLYVYYPGDGGAPTVLPQILTEGIVLGAIGRPPGQT
jgi:thiol:disulfide interchange protein DsbD